MQPTPWLVAGWSLDPYPSLHHQASFTIIQFSETKPYRARSRFSPFACVQPPKEQVPSRTGSRDDHSHRRTLVW